MRFRLKTYKIYSFLFLAMALASFSAPPIGTQEVGPSVRLYVIDCGKIESGDLSFLSDTGEYEGQGGVLSAPCFLISHPKGRLLWDAGLGDEIFEKKDHSVVNPIATLRVQVKLIDQLEKLQLKPQDITYLAFSHLHFDHTGNANLFKDSTWILHSDALAWALKEPKSPAVEVSSFSFYEKAKKIMIDGDHDVFGDGTVRILKTPGHTPGHQNLMVKLQKAGYVILSGDLYHTSANREFNRIPSLNHNRADTLASMDRMETITKRIQARFIIQHEMKDINALPQIPDYLD